MKRNNIRIMVVDDMSGMRNTLRNTLLVLGYHDIVEAQSGDDALRKLRTGESCHLVISDWSMPAMSGIEFHQALKRSPLLKKTPFLMISAKAERDNVIEAFQAGISHFMVKPFSAEALEDKLRMMLGVVV
jgi:two-component system chemotaxis response regulator CheY